MHYQFISVQGIYDPTDKLSEYSQEVEESKEGKRKSFINDWINKQLHVKWQISYFLNVVESNLDRVSKDPEGLVH